MGHARPEQHTSGSQRCLGPQLTHHDQDRPLPHPDNITLRRLHADTDLDQLHELAKAAADPRIWQFLDQHVPPHYKAKHLQRWLRHACSQGALVWSIDGTSTLHGLICCTPANTPNSVDAWLGFWLKATSWGKGIATQACSLACQHLSHSQWLHIAARTRSDNTAARRVLEKVSFTQCKKPDTSLPADQVLYLRSLRPPG